MMTDAEKQIMRDSVRGMPLSQAAALPLYDGVRGSVSSGMPSEQYFALVDGAVVDEAPEMQRLKAQRDAAYDQMVDNLRNAHRADR